MYCDELFNPSFAITSTSSPQSHSVASMPVDSDVFSQRLNAANHQHLNIPHSPLSTSSRARSPYPSGSPFTMSSPRGLNFGSQAATERWGNQQAEDYPHSAQDYATEPETPKTISPKDAILEFTEPESDGSFPLFPQESSHADFESIQKPLMSSQSHTDMLRASLPASLNEDSQTTLLSTQIPTQVPDIKVPQQYPFIAHSSIESDSPPPRLCSSGASSLASGATTPPRFGRPKNTGSDGGTYTCTYHGCSLRFETPSLLQKHKREGHRQSQNIGLQRTQETGIRTTSDIVDTQAGPHRCDRINPSTGKPCNTIFSRPYDLTRHEDTIHNARKQKVRCHLCTEEKTFSRADALTRHYRVCHPDMDLPGRSRRRPG